ncbi:MAG TPA: NAD-dependent protein deacetylase [Jiangellaceae bacterium]
MTDAVASAADLLAGRRAVVLTGAGISTDSGIPDYRGGGSPRRSPMTYAEFRSGAGMRARYWARSHAGWPRISRATPNPGHHALAAMERSGTVTGLITQNVDGLHGKAGSRTVVELHGNLTRVACLGCASRFDRESHQQRLAELNPWFDPTPLQLAPDGDVELGTVTGYRVPRCPRCSGVLKPDVVFFGEAVPRDRVNRSFEMVDAAQVLLVAGSSLTVLSGYRFARHAHARGIPIVIVNRGRTRADPLATLKLDAGCSEVLSVLAGEPALALGAADEVRDER